MNHRQGPEPVTYDPGYDHNALRAKALQLRNIERVLRSLESQRRALGEDLPDVALVAIDASVASMKPIRRALLRELPAIVQGSPIAEWIGDTRGLGVGLIQLLGSMPPIGEFSGPAACWKYVGLDVREGRAPKGQRGERLGFSPVRRAYAIMRVAEPIMKVGGPYRSVYDERKAWTLYTHPPMLTEDALTDPDCLSCHRAMGRTEELRADKQYTRERKAPAVDCAHMGGVHWSDGHRHADALRVTAKAVIRDAWRVARGMVPRVREMELEAVA